MVLNGAIVPPCPGGTHADPLRSPWPRSASPRGSPPPRPAEHRPDRLPRTSRPSLGCYGDPDAITPNLDKLAAQGARFTRCFTHAPVCAPSRSGLITGVYPTTLGTHHMRSKLTKTPPLFVDYLRKAGYFVAWPGKTDFNFDLPKGWVDTTAGLDEEPGPAAEGQAVVRVRQLHRHPREPGPAPPEGKYEKNTARLKPGAAARPRRR